MSRPFADSDSFLDHLKELFATHEAEASYTDRLPIGAHMLQAAAAAAADGADAALIAATLLHDVGHWLADTPEGQALGVDQRHETLGAAYLEPYFPPEVTEPIALHVEAKRFLCAREPDYFARLSVGSVRSLELQGGEMSKSEAAAFESLSGCRAAVRLRRFDEYGKTPGLLVPGFDHYRPLLRSLLRS